MTTIETNLAKLGIILPIAAAPVANYVPFTRMGNIVVISGQLCFGEDGRLSPEHIGKLGDQITLEHGQEAARLCAINLFAQLKNAVANLDNIVSCIRLGGFINVSPGFTALPAVMNGASNLMVEAMGDAGRHARSTVGVAELPMGACVEVEAMFEVRA